MNLQFRRGFDGCFSVIEFTVSTPFLTGHEAVADAADAADAAVAVETVEAAEAAAAVVLVLVL